MPGIYIMQNTMVRGGGKWPAGEKKSKRGKKKEENYIKKGERGLKNASPWVIILKKISGVREKK